MKSKIPMIVGISAGIITAALLIGTGFLEEQNYPCKLTGSNPQGPYYKAGAPFVSALGENVQGEKFILRGKILNQNCDPVASATLDFWHTDSNGNYDLEGYTLRGKIQSDENGEYFLETILPGKYSEGGAIRPIHIHVKVTAPDEPTLTTQLYFENDPDYDFMVRDELIMKINEGKGMKTSNFDFIIKTRN